ncbi:hypothetical protein ACHAXR_002712 [Thalassiosira sp. AJA248-18]
MDASGGIGWASGAASKPAATASTVATYSSSTQQNPSKLPRQRYPSSYHDAVKANPNSPPPDARSVKSLIASRPTVIAATIHSVATSVVAVGILLIVYNYNNTNNQDDDPWLLLLPPTKRYDHLCTSLYYPVGHPNGAILAGAGDIEWVTWLSIVGYTSEVSTAFMNYRWYLINTLEENWIGFGIVNGFVMVSWAGRVVMFTYLLIMEIFPRMHLYVEQKQLFTYGMMVFGHAEIGLLSLHWCIVMCKGGLKSLFVFKKKKPKVLNPQHGFSFAEEVSGKDDNDDATTTTTTISSPARVSLKIIKEEAQAYKDGTIFSDGQVQARKQQSKKSQ